MRTKNIIGSSKSFPQILFRVLAVVAVIALLMTTKIVSNFVAQNIIKNARPEDIQGTAENILYIVSGVILFAFSGLVVFPFFKFALVALGIWLFIKGLKFLYGFFLNKK